MAKVANKTKNGKTYDVYEFKTFDETAKWWEAVFLHNPGFKTKVIGTTIYAWPIEKEDAE
jgi:hypothetical protein